jgi:hypothetical protein
MAGIVYTRNSSTRKKPSARILRLREERKQMFAEVRKTFISNPDRSIYFPEPMVKKNLPPLSNVVGNGFKRSIDDYKWRRDEPKESRETIAEIERKKKRIAPAYNKGPFMYITDDMDPATLGRKV